MDGVNENKLCTLWVGVPRGCCSLQILILGYTWARENESSLVEYIAVDNRLKRKVQDARL